MKLKLSPSSRSSAIEGKHFNDHDREHRRGDAAVMITGTALFELNFSFTATDVVAIYA